MNAAHKTIAGLGCLVLAIALVSFFFREPDSRASPSETTRNLPTSATRHQIATVVDRIKAESAESRFTQTIVSAADLIAETRRTKSDDPLVSPPEGYSFVTHRGQMAKALIDESSLDYPNEDLSSPNWIGTTNAFDLIVDQASQADRDWSFGWILLGDGWQADDLREDLRLLGGEILGSTGRLVRARLPGDVRRLETLLSLHGVEGLGAVPTYVKFQRELPTSSTRDQLSVFVTLMTDDPDEQWRRRLTSMGAVVGRFDADTRTYPANISYRVLNEIVQEDFVLAIEPIRIINSAHDTAVPALGADALRLYRSPGLFYFGGSTVPIGVMDSGLNVNHQDISFNRDSICGANFVTANRRLEDLDLWIDQHGHGTHVTGTIVGNGFGDARLAGVAPAVMDIRFAKALDRTGTGDTLSVVRSMDFLASRSNCDREGQINIPIRPLVVNASLALGGSAFTGREVDQRKLDAVVWRHSQLYVVVQGNEGELGSSNTSAAKNSLAVGAIRDSGTIAFFSSRGPTADGRLAPQVVAPGVSIRSPAGNGSRGEYESASGTSSAAPAVAGIAVLLMDAVPAFRNQPALTRARMMASAISPDPWHATVDRFPANNTLGPGDLMSQYGLGKASARTAVLSRNQSDGWTNGSATSELKDGEYAFQDIEIPEGASRLQLVLTWDEPPSDTISTTVLNDLDLWLDRFGDCGLTACGEYSSRSRKDNVEWIFLQDPPAGVYRAKVVPRRVYTTAPRSALAWTVLHSESTPTLQMKVEEDWVSQRRSRIRLTLTSDAYVAAGTRLRVDCRRVDASSCRDIRLRNVQVNREDGTPGDSFEWTIGTHLMLGEIGAGELQTVEFLLELGSKNDNDDSMRLYFAATGWNSKPAVTTLEAGTTDVNVPVVLQPENDSFAQAFTITGTDGSIDLDLVSATTEAGEPILNFPATGSDMRGVSGSVSAAAALFEPPQGRPAASVWYKWIAPSDGHFRFNTGSTSNDTEPVYVDVYTGDVIAKLDQIFSSGGESNGFFAQRGVTYRIRVSNGTHRAINFGRSRPVTLGWSAVERPANDEFDFGAILADSEGRFEGSNQGATLQPGEWFGGFASSVWHHWTAPQSGEVSFGTSSGNVMVFTGETVNGLRLVSQKPDDRANFSVRSGVVYHIAVASESAFAEGAPYELDWRYVTWYAGNDDFDKAESIGNEMSSSHFVEVDVHSTVEPDEPQETGVRSKWWVWTAPNSATYTWRIDEASYSPLRLSVFSGQSLENLHLEASTGSVVGSTEIKFSSVKDQRYWIATGLPKDDVSAFREENLGTSLTWGPTPPNDELTNMALIHGLSGSVEGSSAFATVSSSEQDRQLGHSSLWWSYQPSEDGWFRFYLEDTDLPYVLAVYERLQDGSLKLLSVSDRVGSQPGIDGLGSAGAGQDMPSVSSSTEVIYRAKAGGRYVLRLGSLSEGPGGEFTLRWEKTFAPVWFRFLGKLEGGDTDHRGMYIDPDHLTMLSGLATDADGTLYAATASGLVTFEHDTASNSLFLSRTLTKDWSSTPRSLLYDPRRHRLYAYGCLTWEVFSLSGSRLVEEGRDEVGSAFCGDGRAFMDSNSSSVYVVRRGVGIEVFEFDEDERLRHTQTIDVLRGTTDALIANSNDYVYVAMYNALVSFERNRESGILTQSSSLAFSQNFINSTHNGLAIDPDDAYLFAFTDAGFGNELVIYDLNTNPASPIALHTLPLDSHLRSLSNSGCLRAETRTGTPGIGLFCDGVIFGIQWNTRTEQLKFTDVVRRIDRYNNAVPFFDFPRGLALSRNGKYAYVASESSGILFFERIGNSGTTE